MQRRGFLVGTATAMVALAGCSDGSSGDGGDGGEAGSDTSGDTGGDKSDDTAAATATATATATQQVSAEGSLRASENFEASDLVGVANPDANTLTISGTLTNVSDAARIVDGFFFNYYDEDGSDLISSNSTLDDPIELAADASTEVELETDDLQKVDATGVGSFEAIVNSRTA